MVDFAPHELEFLREQSAHRRLGFAPDQIKRWLKDAGVAVERQRDLAPAASVGTTRSSPFSLWVGTEAGRLPRQEETRLQWRFAA